MEQAVLYSLDNGCIDSALFLSEQLYHNDKLNHNSRYLHALCLLRAGQTTQAHLLTQAVKHLGCAYIYARTCLSLKTFKAGISAILSVKSSWQSTSNLYHHTATTRRLLPDTAAVQCLLGHLYSKYEDAQKAIESYVAAVKANPFLWEAFEGLLNLGVDMQVKNVFKPSEMLARDRATIELGDQPLELTNDIDNPLATPDVFAMAQSNKKNYTFRPTMPLSRLDEFETPNGPITPTMPSDYKSAFDSIDNATVVPKGRTKSKLSDMSAPRFGLGRSNDTGNPIKRPTSREDNNVTTNGPARRSSRLNMPMSLRTEKKDKKTRSGVAPDPNPNSNVNAAPSVPVRRTRQVTQNLPSTNDEEILLTLLRQVADGCHALSKYRCPKALEKLDALEGRVKSTPYVLSKLGRSHYENGDYEAAVQCYRKLRTTSPMRIADMELYSTCLWHLNQEVDLSYLAHEMLDLDRLSPISWCILANCFSLQKEHDQALKCVARAIQLDPDFAYAHTLEGHEFASNEEFEKAQTSFRNAIRSDKRHYNAWYGLGMTFMKTGNNSQAEYHFQKAHQINPTNAVLVCCIGIVMERGKRWSEALAQYRIACDLAPNNALARFKKAKSLIMARDYTAAMNDLLILKDLAPDEANVHYLLGKMYKQQNDKGNAMRHLTIAMNLDNKASHLVKEAIENMDELEDVL
jgi:anaphase-promoting complex subunit 3